MPRPKRIIIQDVANAWQLLPELKLQASSSPLWRAQGTDSRVPSLTGHMKESDLKIPNWSQRTKGNVLEEPPYRVHCPSFSNMVRAGYGTCGAPMYGRSGGFPGLKWGVGGWVRNVSVPSYQGMLRKCKWILLISLNKMPGDKSVGTKSIDSLTRLSRKKKKWFLNDLVWDYFHSSLDRKS